ncbi:hypothetical protein ACO0K0_02415 [Undibacterium sp. SXout11W]|uniref:hypothetical protein n=1 Tax=Undibacterium sp. SXout11W TaxID=3413050 RepID=UPI003BF2FC5A
MKILSRIWAAFVWAFAGGDDDLVSLQIGQKPPERCPSSTEALQQSPELLATYTPNIPGEPIEIGGHQWILAPLNATAVKQYGKQISEVGTTGRLPDVDLVAKLAYMSLLRNYPGIKLEYVEFNVDHGNFLKIWEVLLNVTGMVAQAGEMMRRVQEKMEAEGLKA